MSKIPSQSSGEREPSVAIVGSGPAGCYTAQMLRKRWPSAQIVVFERLPVPYGLLRYGVSPDHQGTKAIARQFDRLFADGRVHFMGNVEVGKHVSVQQLQDAFDVVVLAAGLGADRPLPGLAGDGVYGAGQVMRWFNSHPDEQSFAPCFGATTTIIGNGNVAVDVLRLLSKHRDSFTGSDLDPRLIEQQPARIHVVGRSPASAAKFDSVMIRELADIDDAVFDVDAVDATGHEDKRIQAKIEALLDLTAVRAVSSPRVHVSFHFGWTSESLESTPDGRTLRLVDTESRQAVKLIETDSVVTAVGFGSGLQHEIDRTYFESDESDLDCGLLDSGLYCSGWFRRGPTGGIPANRLDAKMVCTRIIEDVESGAVTPRKSGLVALAAHLHPDTVDFAGWRRIDAAEASRTAHGRCRTKVPDIATMLDLARTCAPERTTVTCVENQTTDAVGHKEER
ncbi:FAD-dependent oxidoreductase [Rhodococcus aetherivorans]|uniref:FAD-dependent oxidoreductase n=1 Tax=Rhodococcus aetherivorans TaxID=191292 RepID=UPI003666D0EC